MLLNPDPAGKRYDGGTFEVTPDHIRRFVAATNDDRDIYLSGPTAIAPPTFVALPAMAIFKAAMSDPQLGADILRVVHAGADHVLHKVLVAGDVVSVAGGVESVEKTRSGESFTLKIEERTPDGELAAEVRSTMFMRGTGLGPRPAAVPQGVDVAYEETADVDQDQPARYGEASGDTNAIHMDPALARGVGLPGVILQGMCTMAIAARAAVSGVAGRDPHRLRRVAARFSRPVLPPDQLTTRLWHSPDTAATFVFETYDSRNRPVIKDGLVEVGPPVTYP